MANIVHDSKAKPSSSSTSPSTLQRSQNPAADSPRFAASEVSQNRALSPDQLLYLQRTAGNRAVTHMLGQQSPVVQTKLTVGPVGDRYEQEADRIAAQVVKGPAPVQRRDEEEGSGGQVQRSPLVTQITPLVQRHHAIRGNKPPEGEEESEEAMGEMGGVQRSPLPTIQRHHAIRGSKPPEGEEEEEELMGETGGVQRSPLPTIQRHYPNGSAHSGPVGKLPDEQVEEKLLQRKAKSETGFDPGSNFTQRLNANRGRGQRLTDSLRTNMESSFGTSFNQVRVHTGAEAVQMSRDIQAEAFTHGSDIYFNQNKFRPSEKQGRHLLAHELTHVVQQTGANIQRKPEASIQRKWRSPKQWWKDRKEKKAKDKAALDTVNYDSLQGLKRGQILPDVGKMAERRMKDMMKYDTIIKDEAAVSQQIPDALTLIDDDEFMQGVVDAVNVANEGDTVTPKASTAHVPAVRNAVKTALAGHETDPGGILNYFRAMVMPLMKEADSKPKSRILNQFIEQLKDYSKRRAQTSVKGLRPENKYEGLPGMSQTETFLEERQNVQFKEVTVAPEDIPRWAAALQKMDAVKALLDPKTAPEVDQGVGWRGGGKLGDKFQWVKDVRKKKIYGPLATYLDNKHARNTKIFAKLAKVDELMRRIVEPEMLGRVPVPTFHISTRGSQSYTNPFGLRASAAAGKVSIAYNEDVPTIAHEVGHIVEEYLPMDDWADIHMLLSERHKAAGGGTRAAKGESIFTRDEGRYKGKYTTGKYTSRGYSKDNAEVLSMWMQFMAKPEDALRLIQGDPQHAALILRMMRPDDYAATSALRPFDIYLPNPTGGEGPLARYKRAQEKTMALYKM